MAEQGNKTKNEKVGAVVSTKDFQLVAVNADEGGRDAVAKYFQGGAPALPY